MHPIPHSAGLASLILMGSLGLAAPAHAQGEPAPAGEAPVSEADIGAPAKHGIIIGARVGGLLPTSPLTLAPTFGGEVGWFLPWRGHRLGFVLAIDYSSPDQRGTRMDPRVEGGAYSWHLTQQQLSFTPEVLYRVLEVGPVVPYAGVGLRIYRLVSRDRSSSDGPVIEETTETSVSAGVVIPAGAELHVGPGAITAEVLFQFGPIDHLTTGESNTGGLALTAGYRLPL